MDESESRPGTTIRIVHTNGVEVTFEGAIFVGIRDGQVGITTFHDGPVGGDGSLWFEGGVESSHWLDLVDIERLDVGVTDLGGMDVHRPGIEPGVEMSPQAREALEAAVRPYVRYVLDALFNPGELDQWQFEWSDDGFEGPFLWVALTAAGESHRSMLGASYVDFDVRDGLDVFVSGLEDFIAESRFAWGQQRLLPDRPWRVDQKDSGNGSPGSS